MAGRIPARELRMMLLSAATALLAPFVFVGIIVLRKVAFRMHVKTRFWNKRMQHEIARWT
ncbi:MAG TPA: hypothetical protein VG346_05205 [Acidimicrobiales bacterium]|jgi:hypothetical protein|nr:hypothetical protein [Acidimicrobiales bacterium]